MSFSDIVSRVAEVFSDSAALAISLGAVFGSASYHLASFLTVKRPTAITLQGPNYKIVMDGSAADPELLKSLIEQFSEQTTTTRLQNLSEVLKDEAAVQRAKHAGGARQAERLDKLLVAIEGATTEEERIERLREATKGEGLPDHLFMPKGMSGHDPEKDSVL